ncbi:hypothetical protein ACIBO2_56855 [Nonomuraea sp. NPDC050022]|uniref:hypothetical protein n=1 Tax=Nonomuraea sp. NPDC050022 TaxID=3364358 RepID=UPI00378BA54A
MVTVGAVVISAAVVLAPTPFKVRPEADAVGRVPDTGADGHDIGAGCLRSGAGPTVLLLAGTTLILIGVRLADKQGPSGSVRRTSGPATTLCERVRWKVTKEEKS